MREFLIVAREWVGGSSAT